MSKPIKIIECPRDAMQGYSKIFSTEAKIEYLNNLLDVGFDVVHPKVENVIGDREIDEPHSSVDFRLLHHKVVLFWWLSTNKSKCIKSMSNVLNRKVISL